MGVMITSATAIIYGEVDLGSDASWSAGSASPLVVAISMFTVVVATLAVNIAANVVSPANDFANAFPRAISFKTGGLITGILGIADAAVEAARRSVGLHLHLAARLLRRPRLDRRRADRRLLDRAATRAARSRTCICRTAYRYARLELRRRSSRRSPAARSPGADSSIPALQPLYDYAWFVGFAVAFGVYLALTSLRRVDTLTNRRF